MEDPNDIQRDIILGIFDEIQNNDDWSPIINRFLENNDDWSLIIDRFLENGGQIDHIFGGRSNFLHMAAIYGKKEMIKKLLNEGADINYVCPANATALFRAALYGHLECVEILLDAGANITIVPKYADSNNLNDVIEKWNSPVDIMQIFKNHEDSINVEAKSAKKR